MSAHWLERSPTCPKSHHINLFLWIKSSKFRPSSRGEIEYGGIAQIGERLNGIQEVSGSIPLISTKTRPQSHALWSCSTQKQNDVSDTRTKGPRQALANFKLLDIPYFVCSQIKIQGFKVFFHSLFVCRLRDDNDPLLSQEPQSGLRYSFSMVLSNGQKGLICEDAIFPQARGDQLSCFVPFLASKVCKFFC